MDKYEKQKHLGAGAFGSAWLICRKTDGQRLVAKEVNIEGLSDEDRAVARQEASVLRRLNHPNIIAMHEDFIESNNLVIVMEFAGGGDLAQMLKGLKGGRLSEERVLDLFLQVCLGMEHVHSQNFLHRDIKPANILLTSDSPPKIKLADFGVARVLSANTLVAKTVIGTPHYLSPEMVDSKGYNQKSDVWAMGCVLYEMMALKHAFGGNNIMAVVLKIMQGSPEPLPPMYSKHVKALTDLMLSVEPSSRPSVADVLAHPALQKFLASSKTRDDTASGGARQQPRGGAGGESASAHRGSSLEPGRKEGAVAQAR
eukprot:CAMPEP_0181291804 /NCGR_PEP_ID=MMETSP1101-20121128/2165_1 /TAXON_ID=46948 /ORGANISM="Rhodomonas abbreviata, Strain Caron Lab Isolate" /LENGTH=312 /DNA_ID=CAMNT_0023396225 /DNA_START=162 /DNA_END=1097 /DNA_ORIENTATION=-